VTSNINYTTTAGAPRKYSYYIAFHNIWETCIQFLCSSMSGCIYLATHICRSYPERLQAAWVIISRCSCGWHSS
jgi:hypothetical protein